MQKTDQKIFTTDKAWTTKYPHAKVGILVIRNIENIGSNPELDKLKIETEIEVRDQFKNFSRENLNEIPIINSYNTYYKNFGKTYHVRAQIESVINGKSLSSGSSVLTAMFMQKSKICFLQPDMTIILSVYPFA